MTTLVIALCLQIYLVLLLSSSKLQKHLLELPWLPRWLSGKESACSAGGEETQVRSLGQEDPLEKGMATHSSILAWRIHMDRTWQATVHGVAKSRMRLSSQHFEFTFYL